MTAISADLSAVLNENAATVEVTNLVLRTAAGAVTGAAAADLRADGGNGAWTATVDATDLSPRLLEALPAAVRPPAGTLGGAGR